MSEQSTTPENGQPEQAKPDFQPITSQEQLNALLGDRLARERAKFADYDELKAKAEKFDEAEKANLSELEKATEANAQLKQELEAFKLKDLRSQVAASKGLSLEAAAHLVGSTQEELEASADSLVKLIGPKRRGGNDPVPSQGTGDPRQDVGYMAAAQRAKARYKSKQ